jgi:hypothetical protein
MRCQVIAAGGGHRRPAAHGRRQLRRPVWLGGDHATITGGAGAITAAGARTTTTTATRAAGRLLAQAAAAQVHRDMVRWRHLHWRAGCHRHDRGNHHEIPDSPGSRWPRARERVVGCGSSGPGSGGGSRATVDAAVPADLAGTRLARQSPEPPALQPQTSRNVNSDARARPA